MMEKSLSEMNQQERNLSALKLVYRKEQMGDARLCRAETLDRVWDEICNDMGVEDAIAWSDAMEEEIDDGNHD